MHSTPISRTTATAQAYRHGVQDGFRQPFNLVWTQNVEHLLDAQPEAQDVLDAGANMGQFLRAGRLSQAAAEGLRVIPTARGVAGWLRGGVGA